MTKDKAEMISTLEKQKTDLCNLLIGIRDSIARIDEKINAIKWSDYPIGSIIQTKKSDKYKVVGYNAYSIIGKKILKSGLVGEAEHKIYSCDIGAST